MKASVLLVLLSISFGYAQTDSISDTQTSPTFTNGTSGNDTVPEPYYNCITNNPDCSGHGVCLNDGTCRCYYAYFGPASSDKGGPGDGCPWNVTMIPDALDGYIIPVMTYQSVIYTVLFALELYRLVIEIILIRSRVVFDVTNAITVWTLSLLTFHGILGMMDGFNYWGMVGILPYKMIVVVFFLKDRVILILFTSLLFHWAELYYAAIRRMKREEMLKKLKPDYQTNLTIEEVILKINFVSKFRFMYALLGLLNLITFVVTICIHFYSRDLHTALVYQRFDTTFLVVSYILYFIAYVVYGIRLLTILPPSLRPRMKVIMALLTVYAIVGLVNQLVQFVESFGTSQGLHAITLVYAYATFGWVCAFCALNIFMPIWEWHKWFNPFIVRGMISTHTGSSSGTGSRKAKESAAMESSVEMSAEAEPSVPPSEA